MSLVISMLLTFSSAGAAQSHCEPVSKLEMVRLATDYVEKNRGPGYILIGADLRPETIFGGVKMTSRWVVIFEWPKRDTHKPIDGNLTVFADPCGQNIKAMSGL
jgi:hypothetical protein